MKTYLNLLFSIAIFTTANAQHASKSTFVFNNVSGLTINNKQTLDATYFNMKDENYHCFSLISSQEKKQYPYSKQIALAKQRANIIQEYYINEHNLTKETVFIKYGGQYPSLWLHKPDAFLTASGIINLEDKYQQCYTYNSNQNKTIYTDNGNILHFEAYSFETLDGKEVKSNNINICLWEFADKKSLVYANLTTSTNGKMLETAGSFYIKANLDGEPLQLRQGKKYLVEIPTSKPYNDMFTYYGYEKDGFVNWNVDKDEPILISNNNPMPEQIPEVEIEQAYTEEGMYFGETLSADNEILDRVYYEDEGDETFYQLTAGKLGWINCDRFYEVKNTSVLAVKVDTKEPVVVRLIFRDIESVMPCYANSNHKNKYEASGIPTGEKVLILAYAVKDNNAVLGYKEIIIGENNLEEIALNDLSKTRFESAVKELLY